MLKKRNRLKKYSAFQATYKLKNTAADNYFCIYLGKEKDNAEIPTKFGFVVSKKIHKRSVVRNRTKRLMRECVRLMLKNNLIPNANKYLSIICVAKHNSISANFNEVNVSLNTLFSRLFI